MQWLPLLKLPFHPYAKLLCQTSFLRQFLKIKIEQPIYTYRKKSSGGHLSDTAGNLRGVRAEGAVSIGCLGRLSGLFNKSECW